MIATENTLQAKQSQFKVKVKSSKAAMSEKKETIAFSLQPYHEVLEA